MTDKEHFDFWYAVNNTEVLLTPSRKLETFGTTILNYHLVSELMDEVNKVRVREGRLEAARPEIITPPSFTDTPLDGFGDEASEYIGWLQDHMDQLRILKYGFRISKQEQNEYILTDTVSAVTDRVREELVKKDDPTSALALGVDKPWEVSLLKLMVDIVEDSVAGHVQDLEGKDLFRKAAADPQGIRREIEQAFRAAVKDRTKLDSLAQLLKDRGLFSEYEDRFFSLVRSS